MVNADKSSRIFEFGRFRLDAHERLLSVDGKTVELTPKVFDLLLLLVQNPGRLLEKSWLVSTLWPDTFVEEANLSVNISMLRRAMESASGEHFIETVPKRGYRFAGEVRDLAPVASEVPVSEPESAAASAEIKEPRRWLQVGVLSLLMLGGLVLVLERSFFFSISSPSQVRSLAVLPFRLITIDTGEQGKTGNNDDRLLEIGMADAVIRELSSVKKVRVRSTSAIQSYHAKTIDAAATGRELQVDVVLEGRIQHAGRMIRVSVELLRVSDGATIWADRFDDYYSNIFQVQDSIAEKVANALKMKLTEADRSKMAKHGTDSIAAYQLYLQGQYCEMQHTRDAPLEDCIARYQGAVDKDPKYALAYAGLSRMYMEVTNTGARPDALKKGQAAAERAILLDENLPEAHLARGIVMFRSDWDWLGARREFSRGLALDDHSAMAHWYMALLLAAMGETEHALAEMKKAQLLDPASENLRNGLGWAYYCNRNYDDAIRESKMAVVMNTQSYVSHHQLGKAYLHARRYAEAQAEFEATTRLDSSFRGFADLGQLYALTGRAVEGGRILTELKQVDARNATYEAEYMRAVLEGSLGHIDAAFQSLELAVAKRLSRAIWMQVDPDMDPLRTDPRFHALLRRIRLSE